MAEKINRFFKNSYPEKKFDKKILGRVYLKEEKELLLSVYDKKEGFYTRKEELETDEVKKLNKLSKIIKKNSGALGIGKTGVLVFLVIIAVLFNIFLKNPLAEKGMKIALESIFKAESNVTGLDLKILSGRISYDSLEIADRSNLSRNLFETGKAAIDLRMSEIIKGKFSVEEIRLESIASGTQRKMPARPLAAETAAIAEPAPAPQSADTAPGLMGVTIPDRESVEQIIKQNMADLSLPAAADALAAGTAAAVSALSDSADAAEKELKVLEGRVKEITETDISSIRTPDEARKVLTQISETAASADNLTRKIGVIGSDAAEIEKSVTAGIRKIEESAENDIAYIVSRIPFPSPGSITLSTITEAFFRKTIEPYLEKYAKILEIYEMIRQDDKVEKKPSVQRGGRVIHYQSTDTPRLLLSLITGSYLGRSSTYSLEINNITNNQDLLGLPLTFEIKAEEEKKQTVIEGFFDSQKDSDTLSGLEFTHTGGSFSDADNFSAAGIENIKTSYTLKGNAGIKTSGRISGTAALELKDFTFSTTSGVGRIIGNILDNEEKIDVSAGFEFGRGVFNINISSSLDNIIARSISPERLKEEAEKIVRSLIDEMLKENLAAASGNTQALIAEGRERINKLEAEVKNETEKLERKKRELENIIKSEQEKLEREVKEAADKASAAAAAAAAEAQRRIRSLPGLRP